MRVVKQRKEEIGVSPTSSTSYGSKPPKEASRPRLRKPRARRWAAVALDPIAITKDSHSSDSGRLVGGATHTHTQTGGEAGGSCQNSERAEPKAQVGRRGWWTV